MPICEKCGNEINSDEKYCGRCGAPVIHKGSSNDIKSKGTQTASEDVFIAEHKYKLIKWKGNIAVLMIIFTALAIIIGLIAVWSELRDLKDDIRILVSVVSGIYQTILWISLIIWIYMLKKSLIQQEIFEVTGKIK